MITVQLRNSLILRTHVPNKEVAHCGATETLSDINEEASKQKAMALWSKLDYPKLRWKRLHKHIHIFNTL